ncbi:MAG TPA: hypothetical protein VNT50_09445, partial [Microbacterium sp.]|nr:hypothetical protein [Microbacterium sp.]
DYASVMQVVADHYEVAIAARSIHRAREILGGAGIERTVVARPAPAAPTAPPVGDPVIDPERVEPPRYGERVTPSPTPGAEPPPPAADETGDARDARPSQDP